ncbi:MAG: aquaporin [Planctomycetota bacterium]
MHRCRLAWKRDKRALRSAHEIVILGVIEALLLALFMVAACILAIALEHPASPLRRALVEPLMRRFSMGAAIGLTAVVLITSTWGRRSGAHLNPAVTLTFFGLGKLSARNALVYVTFQMLGGAFGVWLVDRVTPSWIAAPEVRWIVTVPGAAGELAAWIGEGVIACLTMSAVLLLDRSPRLSRYTPTVIGVLLCLYITFEAPYSGMSLNPARSLGSAVLAGEWRGFWIYVTAPLAGMFAAGALFGRRYHGRSVCAKLARGSEEPCPFHCDCSLDAAQAPVELSRSRAVAHSESVLGDRR